MTCGLMCCHSVGVLGPCFCIFVKVWAVVFSSNTANSHLDRLPELAKCAFYGIGAREFSQ